MRHKHENPHTTFAALVRNKRLYIPCKSLTNANASSVACSMMVFVFTRYNFADSNAEAEDCDGHGTHVSSTAVGRTVGVAKEARVVAVRVLNCQGSGTVSNVVAGLNWVAQNAVAPAVVTMSLVPTRSELSCACRFLEGCMQCERVLTPHLILASALACIAC